MVCCGNVISTVPLGAVIFGALCCGIAAGISRGAIGAMVLCGIVVGIGASLGSVVVAGPSAGGLGTAYLFSGAGIEALASEIMASVRAEILFTRALAKPITAIMTSAKEVTQKSIVLISAASVGRCIGERRIVGIVATKSPFQEHSWLMNSLTD